MQVLADHFHGPCRPDTLLVLLPPAQAQLVDFHTYGFVAAVRERGIPIDIVLAEITYQQVMAHTSVATLHTQVIGPAVAAGYRKIWLAGISIGAFNALHYAAVHAEHLAGVHLMAPYPGTGDVLAEISAAGGPEAWARMPPNAQNDERTWWRWLCREALARQWTTPVYFSTGDRDRFLRGQRMMANLLPDTQVSYESGGHNWPTWQLLWQRWLNDGPLSHLASNALALEKT